MTMEQEVCAICRSPKRSAGSGSLTQWIVSCNCDLMESGADKEQDEKLSVSICRTCGKRIGEGRAGSFTQFIFRSDLCCCQLPGPHPVAVPAAETDPASIAIDESVICPDEPELDLEDSLFPGERYKPVRELGSGGGGAVYLCRDRILNKLVAVKLLHGLEARQIIAFQDEARATSKLTHEAIVRLLDFGVVQDAVPFMVLEYVPGRSLSELFASLGSMSWQQSREIFLGICEALSYAHDHGVLHRDVKPDNILVAEDETGNTAVRIIDFGVSAAVGHQDESDFAVVGAPLYMSPDQGLGSPYDARSEVYSLGCVLFEALTGSPPFRGDTALETLRLHAEAIPPSPDDLVQGLPAGLSDIVLRCLAKDPGSRFQTMGELRRALEGVDEDLARAVPSSGRSGKSDRLTVVPGGVKISFLIGLSIVLVIGVIRHFAGPDPGRADREEIPANATALSEYRKDANFFSTIPTDVVDRQFGWTGGKWRFKRNKTHGSIEAGGHEVSDDDFKLLAGKDFDQIKLTMESKATGSGLEHIKGQRLESFWSMSPGFDDGGAARLVDFPDLTLVKIHFTRNLSVQAFRNIARLPKLRELELRSVKMPPGGLEALSECRTLGKLMMEMTEPVVNSDLEPLTRLRHLRSLRVNSLGRLDDGCIPHLLKMRLETLEIGLTGISDAGLERLVSMKTLNRLGLTVGHYDEVEIRASTKGDGGACISAEALKRFKRLRPDCKVFEIDDLGGVSLF